MIEDRTSADTRSSHRGATHTYFSFCVSNLKMCTVSVLLEADRYRPSMLNASEQMLTHLGDRAGSHIRTKHKRTKQFWTPADSQQLLYRLTPLRNSKSFWPSGMEKTRMTVPCEEAEETHVRMRQTAEVQKNKK